MLATKTESLWNIKSLYEFQYFNCPVCVFKDRSKQEFIDHAINIHPESANGLSNVRDDSLSDIDWPFEQIKDECPEDPLEESSFDDTDTTSDDQDEEYAIINLPSLKECFVVLEHKDFPFCDLCCQYYASKESLKNHIASLHTPSKPSSENNLVKIVFPTTYIKNLSAETSSIKIVKGDADEKSVSQPIFQNQESFAADYEEPILEERKENEVGDNFDNITEEKTSFHYHLNPKIECQFCQIGFSHFFRLSKHLVFEHGEESELISLSTNVDVPPKCLKCIQDYIDNESLVHHISQAHFRKCAICLLEFENLIDFAKHYEVEHHIICYICSKCDLVFKNLPDKKEHVENCDEGFQCFYCYEKLNARTFLYHITKGHKGKLKQKRFKSKEEKELAKKKYICKICNGEYSSKPNLKLHIARMHDKSLYLTCHLCGKTVTGKQTLNNHIKWVHDKIKDINCDKCGKGFASNAQLREHKLRIHEGGIVKNHMCELCGKAFEESGKLKRHVLSVHEGVKSFHCDNCGVGFTTSIGLRKHNERAHSTYRKFPCDRCDKAYVDAQSLKHHIQSFHEGVKNHKCGQCFKAFFRKENLKAHIKTVHQGIRDFKCDMCEKEFTRKKYLDQHIAQDHSKFD